MIRGRADDQFVLARSDAHCRVGARHWPRRPSVLPTRRGVLSRQLPVASSNKRLQEVRINSAARLKAREGNVKIQHSAAENNIARVIERSRIRSIGSLTRAILFSAALSEAFVLCKNRRLRPG